MECVRLFPDCFCSRFSASPAINRVRLGLPVISLCSLRILMALLGPMVVVAETPATELLDAIGKAGGFPVIEANWARAPSAISEILPAALVLAEAKPPADARLVAAVIKKIESRGGPYMPVLARVDDDGEVAIPSALPIAIDEPPSRLLARH